MPFRRDAATSSATFYSAADGRKQNERFYIVSAGASPRQVDRRPSLTRRQRSEEDDNFDPHTTATARRQRHAIAWA